MFTNEITARESANRLNILVAGQDGGLNSVYLRYSYVAYPAEIDENGRDPKGRLCSTRVRGSEVFEPNEPNHAGRPGAYCHSPDWAGIQAAVAAIRADWGDLPVQVNETRYRPALTA